MEERNSASPLSGHFGYHRLISFTLPSICMMLFTSLYLVVDGYFVSNFVGKEALAAVNLVFPILSLVSCLGLMFGSGGSALVAKTLGEGDEEKARREFSIVVSVSLSVGILLSVPLYLFLPRLLEMMGAEGSLLLSSIKYGRIAIPAIPFFLMQLEAGPLFIAMGKPSMGFWMTVAANGINIVLDALFCIVLHLGVEGAAAATATGFLVGGVIPVLYFALKRKETLRLVKAPMDMRVIGKSAANGSSELVSNVSSALVGMLYNGILLSVVGEDGVAAYSVIMYINMLFLSVFIGFSMGTAPIVSFQYGAGDREGMRDVHRKSLVVILSTSVAMLLLSMVLSRPLSIVFTGYDKALLYMTVRAFRIYSVSFLFAGINMYASSFFTALNDGAVSAILSVVRVLVFQTLSVLVLSRIFGLDGIWYSIVIAEALSLAVSFFFLKKGRKRYGY